MDVCAVNTDTSSLELQSSLSAYYHATARCVRIVEVSICTSFLFSGQLAAEPGRSRYMIPSALKWTKGSWETTSSYNWFSPYYEDYIHTKFCGVCGTFIGGAGEDYTMINSRTFDNIDISKLTLQPFHARGRTAKMDAEEEAKKAAE